MGQSAQCLTRSSDRSPGTVAYAGAVSDRQPLQVMTSEEFSELLRQAAAPTADDVPITSDGQRLDSKEKALAFCVDLAAKRGVALDLDAAAMLLGMTRTHLGRLCEEGRVACASVGTDLIVPGTRLARILRARQEEAGRVASRGQDSQSGATEH